jgi:hypothetical protein
LYVINHVASHVPFESGIINLARHPELYLRVSGLPVIKHNYASQADKGRRFLEDTRIACRIPIVTAPYDLTTLDPQHDADGRLHLATHKYEGEVMFEIVDADGKPIVTNSEMSIAMRIEAAPTQDQLMMRAVRIGEQILEYVKYLFAATGDTSKTKK